MRRICLSGICYIETLNESGFMHIASHKMTEVLQQKITFGDREDFSSIKCFFSTQKGWLLPLICKWAVFSVNGMTFLSFYLLLDLSIGKMAFSTEKIAFLPINQLIHRLNDTFTYTVFSFFIDYYSAYPR